MKKLKGISVFFMTATLSLATFANEVSELEVLACQANKLASDKEKPEIDTSFEPVESAIPEIEKRILENKDELNEILKLRLEVPSIQDSSMREAARGVVKVKLASFIDKVMGVGSFSPTVFDFKQGGYSTDSDEKTNLVNSNIRFVTYPRNWFLMGLDSDSVNINDIKRRSFLLKSQKVILDLSPTGDFNLTAYYIPTDDKVTYSKKLFVNEDSKITYNVPLIEACKEILANVKEDKKSAKSNADRKDEIIETNSNSRQSASSTSTSAQ